MSELPEPELDAKPEREPDAKPEAERNATPGSKAHTSKPQAAARATGSVASIIGSLVTTIAVAAAVEQLPERQAADMHLLFIAVAGLSFVATTLAIRRVARTPQRADPAGRWALQLSILTVALTAVILAVTPHWGLAGRSAPWAWVAVFGAPYSLGGLLAFLQANGPRSPAG